MSEAMLSTTCLFPSILGPTYAVWARMMSGNVVVVLSISWIGKELIVMISCATGWDR